MKTNNHNNIYFRLSKEKFSIYPKSFDCVNVFISSIYYGPWTLFHFTDYFPLPSFHPNAFIVGWLAGGLYSFPTITPSRRRKILFTESQRSEREQKETLPIFEQHKSKVVKNFVMFNSIFSSYLYQGLLLYL